jgi:hypothetical protein
MNIRLSVVRASRRPGLVPDWSAAIDRKVNISPVVETGGMLVVNSRPLVSG